MKDNLINVGAFIVFAAVWFVAGYHTGGGHRDAHWRKECVRMGVAEYDSKTGEWRLLEQYREGK